jgi:hypothetical protein
MTSGIELVADRRAPSLAVNAVEPSEVLARTLKDSERRQARARPIAAA